MLAGRARITAVDEQGRTFIDDVGEGDLWNFPSIIPHSIHRLEEGCEFLLVFDDGSFSENETFLLTHRCNHVPRDVLAKNFGVREAHSPTFRPFTNTIATSSLAACRAPSPAEGARHKALGRIYAVA